MDGFVRAIGGGISGFVGNAVAAVGGAIHSVVAQLERVVPGGAVPVLVLALAVIVLIWNLLRR
jgi:hypothetical protein